MNKRRITLEDGRYLIFYTFNDERGEARDATERKHEEGPRREPEAKPVAEEERRV